MALAAMQKGNLDAVAEDVHGRIAKQSVELDRRDGHARHLRRRRSLVGHLKAYAGTDSCELPHVAVVQSGRLHVRMDDGSEDEFGPRDVMLLPPGHDAWSVGDQPCVFVEFSRGNDYYEELAPSAV